MKPEFVRGIILLVLALAVRFASAQESTNRPARSLPVQLKVSAPAPVAGETPAAPPPSFQGITRPMVLPVSPIAELTNGILAFDRDLQETLITDGAAEARFVFSLTNVSPLNLTITNVAVSCGCTVVELPPLPWVLKPGERGLLPVTLDVAGKQGVIAKTLQVRTDRGVRTLLVKANIKPPADTAE
jgi:hypothetical protein